MEDKRADILLIEDNASDEVLALRALKKHRAISSVAVTRDGEEALEYLFCTGRYADRPRLAPRLILLDLKLPKVTGLEVLKRIKADPYTRRIPVVMLTSSSEEKDVLESYDLGVNSYILKPVDFSDFSTLIQDMVSYWLVINHPPTIHYSNVQV